MAAIAADEAVRVLVVTADGPSFCAGADLVDLFGDAPGQPIDQIRNDLMQVYDSFLKILDLPIPTIAAVRGAAIGAGLNLALCCDVRLAAPDVNFGAVFSRIGLHPGGGCSYFLTRLLGAQGAMRLLLDGGSLNAESALKGGLVSEIVEDPEDHTVVRPTTSVNDAPLLGGITTLTTTDDKTTATPFTAVTIADADSDASPSVQNVTVTVAAGRSRQGNAAQPQRLHASVGRSLHLHGHGRGRSDRTRRARVRADAESRRSDHDEDTTFTIEVDDSLASVSDDTTVVRTTSVNDHRCSPASAR